MYVCTQNAKLVQLANRSCARPDHIAPAVVRVPSSTRFRPWGWVGCRFDNDARVSAPRLCISSV